MRVVRLTVSPTQCYLFGRRVHHGTVGVALLATGDKRLAALGLLLVLHDWHDRNVWIRDLLAHPAWQPA